MSSSARLVSFHFGSIVFGSDSVELDESLHWVASFVRVALCGADRPQQQAGNCYNCLLARNYSPNLKVSRTSRRRRRRSCLSGRRNIWISFGFHFTHSRGQSAHTSYSTRVTVNQQPNGCSFFRLRLLIWPKNDFFARLHRVDHNLPAHSQIVAI